MHVASLELESGLDRVRQGDEDAARALVARLNPLVMKIVRANLPHRMAVEDLTQEVFARLFDRLSKYEVRSGIPFEHWVSRLAVRTCLDALRSERRRPEIRLADFPPGEALWFDYLVSGSSGPPEASARDAREVVERLLNQLPPEDRLVISLLDLDEKSAAEVSALTGWSRVGVRVRAFRARTRLRRVAVLLKERGEL